MLLLELDFRIPVSVSVSSVRLVLNERIYFSMTFPPKPREHNRKRALNQIAPKKKVNMSLTKCDTLHMYL